MKIIKFEIMEIKEIFRDPLSAFGFIILCFGAIMCIVVPLYALFNEIKNKKISA
jgi:hypothetical protein